LTYSFDNIAKLAPSVDFEFYSAVHPSDFELVVDPLGDLKTSLVNDRSPELSLARTELSVELGVDLLLDGALGLLRS